MGGVLSPQGTCTLQGGCEDKHAVEEVTEISRQPLPQPHPLSQSWHGQPEKGAEQTHRLPLPLPPLSDMHNTVHRTLLHTAEQWGLHH